MKLLDSLLDAIVRLEGDALVMHVGEKPYVVTASSAMNAYRGPLAWGQVELSSRVLTFDAVSNMLGQILPADQQQALTEFGAIEHEIPSPAGVADRFTLVAARGGEDVWVEVRRRPVEVAPAQAASDEETPTPEAPTAAIDGPPSSQPAAQVVGDTEESGIPLVAAAQEPVNGGSAPDVQPQASESIVVAIPGQAAEQFELDAVADHAIQIVDEEPQGVPTEEEVDAMLAATAISLITSGLSGEVVADGDADDGEIEIVLTTETNVVDIAGERQVRADSDRAVEAGDAVPEAAEPAFELSPPALTAQVEEDVTDQIDAPLGAPAGTPLFSDEAMRAAAVEPAAEAASSPVETPIAEGTPVVEQPAPVAEWTPAVEQAPMSVETPVQEQAPPAELAPVVGEPAPVGETAPAIAQAPMSKPTPVVSEMGPSRAAIEEAPMQEIGVAEAAGQAIQQLYEPAALQAPETIESIHVPAEHGQPEERAPGDAEDVGRAVASAPAAADVVDTLNAGAGLAMSDATSPESVPSAAEMPMEVTPEPRQREESVSSSEAPLKVTHAEVDADTGEETRQAVVVPLARMPMKPESVPVPFTPSADAALMHTLRVAAARGASTVYVVAQSKPMIRIDGEIGPLESEPTLTAADVDRLVMELAPPRRRDALQNGPVEWLCDVPEIGRVRCLTFRDHRGPGVLFRMFPPRAISADQLALTPEVQALCQQSDGLVLVTGARASGKSTLLNAFVDLINRTRSDHLITIESQIGFVHESRRSFISQRESRGDAELAATYVRAALREDPDVMVIEDLKTAELVSAALEAAESGRLVLASVPAASTIAAIERMIEVFPPDRRAKARTSLATAMRGVIAQVLLRRAKGGRVAAREILLNTPAVSQLVLEGKMFQLPVALDSGRRHGMVPLTDSLAAHVRDGTVQVAEAYRKALDRAALVALLKREGIDTSFAERLA